MFIILFKTNSIGGEMFKSLTSGRRWALVIIMLALASLACGGLLSQPTPTPVPTPTPAPTSTPVPTPTTASPTDAPGADLVIENTGNITVCYVFISLTTDTEWGPDQLGESDVIPSGSQFTITDIPPGSYDLRATDCEGNDLALEYGVTFDATGYTWTIAASTQAVLVVNNQSSYTVCNIFISPVTADNWGPNVLEERIQPSQSVTFTLPGGDWDFRAESCNGETFWEQFGSTVETEFTWNLQN
jgi:hypothetical protein